MKQRICKTCGHMGKPKTMTPGSFIIEIVLWLCFLVPGLFFSIWRLTARYSACAKCGSREIIPLDSPVGKELAAQERN